MLGLAMAVGLLGLPGRAMAACGPASANNPCVDYHSGASATGTGSSLSFSLTVPSTTECYNSILVVLVSMMNSSGNVADVSSITWTVGSTSQSLYLDLSQQSSRGDNARKRVVIKDQVSPTPGTGTVQINVAGGSTAQMVAGAVVACGVDQANPMLALQSGYGNTSTATVTLTSADGALVVDVLAVDANVSASVGNSATQRWQSTTGSGSNSLRGAGSTKESTASSESPSWSLGATTEWVLGAVTLRPWTPTAVGLESFTAGASDGGTVLRWHVGSEPETVGYRLYRRVDGRMVPLSRDLVLGSGLAFGGGRLQAGSSYAWFDPDGAPGDQYWLEAVAAGGESTWHGPFTARRAPGPAPRVARALTVGDAFRAWRLERGGRPARVLSGTIPKARAAGGGATRGRPAGRVGRSAGDDTAMQWRLAATDSVKIRVTDPGWYRVTFRELEEAGFTVSDPTRLQLYADGVEQAILVSPGGQSGDGFVEFLGTPQDTPASGATTYWLVEGPRPGLRVGLRDGGGDATAPLATVPFTVRLKEHLVYVPGVLNGERENFFGQLIAADPAVLTLRVDHPALGSTEDALLRVALQGVTAEPFTVAVAVNGTPVGELSLDGALWREVTLPVPVSHLVGGDNTITLSRTDDVSLALVDTVELTYPRLTMAGNGQTAFTFPEELAGRDVRLAGFQGDAVRVLDVSDPRHPVEVTTQVAHDAEGSFVVFSPPARDGATTVLAFSGDQVAHPAKIEVNSPSTWHAAEHAADMLVIAPRGLLAAVEPLATWHRDEGLAVVTVAVEDIYDEFSFGAKDPWALRRFLLRAQEAWQRAPRYVLLVGDASYDPRDYLGFGQDLVPTRLMDTDTFETATDIWFADFDDDGIPAMAVGRLPVDSPEEAAAVVRKLVAGQLQGVRLGSVLTVADVAKGDNFASITRSVASLLSDHTSVEEVDEDRTGAEGARDVVLDALDSGVDFVTYSGHGTVDRWRGDVLTAEDAAALRNGDHPSVFIMMNCLNGLFQEPLLEGLGEALLRNPDGGALAVWASTATTNSSEQGLLVRGFYRHLNGAQGMRLGDAVLSALQETQDLTVRRSWVLLGDPAMYVEGVE